jgi:DNA-3-methyladenine glycosylase I
MADDDLAIGPDGQRRCFWVSQVPEFMPYHDEEWGFPVDDDIRLFEKMTLESFQSGLSWRTILNKRDAFRTAFGGFDFRQVAEFNETDIERLLKDAAIVRHRGKIESAISNARVAIELVEQFGSLAAYFWQFEPAPSERPSQITREAILHMPQTRASLALSKDLKRHGWRFFGPTTAYAFMQAMGLVNDHQEGCCCRARAESERRAFSRPRPR